MLENSQSATPLANQTKTNPLLLLAAEIAGLIAAFIVFLLFLNFFNVISLSRIYPKTFGFLPHLSQTTNIKSTAQIQTTNTPPVKSTVPNQEKIADEIAASYPSSVPINTCPVSEGCKNSFPIGDQTQPLTEAFSGLGINISQNAPILAFFDGKISVNNLIQNGQSLTVVKIQNPNFENITYQFNKSSFTPSTSVGTIKQGDKIGNLNTNNGVAFEGKTYSIVFSVQSANSDNSYFRLVSSGDGKTIDNLRNSE
jgi:hypothetical protein